MKRGYTIHWWVQFMVYAKDCLRTLSEDDLRVVNTKKLPVDSNTNAVDLPNDYLDYISIGTEVGQLLKPLVETDSINPLIARTSDFTPTTYGAAGLENSNNIIYYGSLSPYYWNTVFWNDYGEFTGRIFGFGAGTQDDVFSIFPERNQIQLSEKLSCTHIVIRYISDGMNSDAATQISPYAYETIDAFIMWQMKLNTRTYSAGEAEMAKQAYIDERRILRARLSDLTKEKLKRLFQRASYASPKSL